MKSAKTIIVLIKVTALLMAVAGSTSAAMLTSPSGTQYTGEVHATLKTPNSALLRAGVEDTCGKWTVALKITANDAGVGGNGTGPRSSMR